MINVFGSFNGLSCGQIALDRLKIENNYYSSEINKDAIKINMDNYPNTIQVGDITKVNCLEYPQIDLLLGGSSCQNFSLAGNKKGMITSDCEEIVSYEQYKYLKDKGFLFSGESYLFWEFIRLLKEFKPKYFLLENVIMSSKWKNIITQAVGVNPIEINSNLVSFQNRKRLYWTNIPNISQPQDQHIYLYDNYDKVYDESLILKGKGLNKLGRERNRVISVLSKKCPTIMKSQDKLPTDAIVFQQENIYRYPTRKECELMQNLPLNYTKSVNYRLATGLIGNCWTVNVITHLLKNMEF